jgi:hypothetical protein
MGVAEMRRVKQLEDENRRLKTLVADLTLDKHCCSRSSPEDMCEDVEIAEVLDERVHCRRL